MTGLRLTRRRLLSAAGMVAVGAGGLWAVPPRRISTSIETVEWVLSVSDTGRPSAPRVADLEPAARDAVEDAIEGKYETADPPAAVRKLFHVDRTTYVRSGDTYYRLDPTLPIVEIWREPVTEAEAEDHITFDELEECTHPDPRGFVPPPIGSEEDPERRYYLEPRVRSCLDEHPYVEHGEGNFLRYHLAVDDPGEPYTVEATRVSAKTVADIEGSVVEWADVPAEARELLLTAERDTLHRQEIPDTLRDIGENYDYVRRVGRFYRIDLDHPGAAPIRVEARIIDAESREFDPAWLELLVTNTGERAVDLKTGAPASLAPFGILGGRQVDGDGTITLWSPEYVKDRLIGTLAGRVMAVASAGVGVTLTPNETRTARYAVRRNSGRLERGIYRVRDEFGVEVTGSRGETTTYPFVLDVSVE